MDLKKAGVVLAALAATGLIAALVVWRANPPRAERFAQAMTRGQGFLQRGDAGSAITQYSEAVGLLPESLEANLNLASSHLLAGNAGAVVDSANRALALDPNSAAAYYLLGCARLRLNQPEEALKAFESSRRIDPAVTPLDFQLGLAHERLGQFEDAVRAFETVVHFEPDHLSAHFQLSRLYQRLGRTDEAAAALGRHQEALAKNPGVPSGIAAFEKSKYTQPRVAFNLSQPDPAGVPVKFVDGTADWFGAEAGAYRAPMAVLDYNHDGRNSLFVTHGGGFRLLDNTNGHFSPMPQLLPGTPNGVYSRMLAGDLNNDRFEDVVVLGAETSHAFRFATNGQVRELTSAAGLRGLRGIEGTLADLDFTGKLDLLVVLPGNEGIRVYRNLGNFYFLENTNASGLPVEMKGVQQVLVDDWLNEDVPGVFFMRKGQPPVFHRKERAGGFVETNSPAVMPAGKAAVCADFNNDLRLDLAVFGEGKAGLLLNGIEGVREIPASGFGAQHAMALDYDNDGWQDLIAWGTGLRVWRNKGNDGFEDVTASLGLEGVPALADLAPADFDGDGDTDLVGASETGLKFWRNDGGNRNKQLKLRLVGNRSNASGLGVRVELIAGHWRTLRTVNRLPVEIGVGASEKIEVLKTLWFDLATTMVDLPVEARPFTLEELALPTGSCPYLYAWDGKQFRFVTDVLGASPLGLPVSKDRYVEADPDEYLELGGADQFPPKDGHYEIRLTEELREVLYLDCARLVAVDHPADTIVVPTSKMMPGRPFPPHQLWTLHPLSPAQDALRSDGTDMTSALRAMDGIKAGPVTIREAQLRGLAEPWWIEFTFPEIPRSEPLVLVMNGWLRFGGGMANIAGSIDPTLPFPFPHLQVQTADGMWRKLDVVVGVPAGKTKTILVDLEGKLPQGSKRFRLSCAFEMYWDVISLAVKTGESLSRRTELALARADLRWHGYGTFETSPPSQPLTPRYDERGETPPWSRTPAGWCTRYGDARELLLAKDNAMALLNGGDEVALSFAGKGLPETPAGMRRDFFLFLTGWDKDADFHVGQGWRVEPLPYAGMDDQAYGKPGFTNLPPTEWQKKYNTRWVGPLVLDAAARAPRQSSRK